jgi:site-specific recombinase XerC
MEPVRNERTGLYRLRVPVRIPRSVPDGEFNEILAKLPSHRDRALVAFYISTGARASELLSVTQGGVDPGRRLISVIRKGSRAVQELPASTDARRRRGRRRDDWGRRGWSRRTLALRPDS